MMLMKKHLKHEVYLRTPPGAYAALQKRIEDLGSAQRAITELATEIVADVEKTQKSFAQKPSLESARALFAATTKKKAFLSSDMVNAAHASRTAAERHLKLSPDSFQVYVPILNCVAELLREDVQSQRVAIQKSLADVDADAADVDLIKPLPSLLVKLSHVENVIQQCSYPREHHTDALVASIDQIILGNLPEPAVRTPVYAQGGAPGAKELQRIS